MLNIQTAMASHVDINKYLITKAKEGRFNGGIYI
jgi:hypothetical protein